MHGVPGKEGGRSHLASRLNTRPAQELDPGDAAQELDPGDAQELDPGDRELDPGGPHHM